MVTGSPFAPNLSELQVDKARGPACYDVLARNAHTGNSDGGNAVGVALQIHLRPEGHDGDERTTPHA